MPEISLNILDVAENSTRAGASLIQITVDVQPNLDRLTVIIADDGCGMTKEQVERVTDPFYTSRTTRKVGLGVPFFQAGRREHRRKLLHRIRAWKRDHGHCGLYLKSH